MAKLTGSQIAEKHARRLSAATQDIELGVKRVTVSPTELAAKKKNKMLQNLTIAVNNGKWEAGLKRVTREDWQDKMINKGIGRIAQGVQESLVKTGQFFDELNEHQDRLKLKIDAMSDLTIEDSGQRMLTWMRGMSEFKRRG